MPELAQARGGDEARHPRARNRDLYGHVRNLVPAVSAADMAMR